MPVDPATAVIVTANRYSHLTMLGADADHWILRSAIYAVARKLRDDTLRQQLSALVRRNDGLRLFVYDRDGTWWQRIGPPELCLDVFVYDADVGDGGYADFLDRTIASVRATMSLRSRNLVFVAIEDRCRSRFHLMALFHHVLMDGVALDAFETQLLNVLDDPPGEPTTDGGGTYQDYCAHYENLCRSMIEVSANYWLGLAWSRIGLVSRKIERDAAEMDEKWSIETSLFYSASSLSLVRRDLARVGGSIISLLLIGLAEAYGRWGDADHLLLGLVHHNRLSDTPRFARTIGWISETIPILLPARGQVSALHESVASQLSMIRTFGASYGFNRYLAPLDAVRAAFARHPAPEICLNINLGRDQVESGRYGVYRHRPMSPLGRRVHPIAVGATLKDDRFRISVDCSGKLLDAKRVEDFLVLFHEAVDRTLQDLSCARLEMSPLPQQA